MVTSQLCRGRNTRLLETSKDEDWTQIADGVRSTGWFRLSVERSLCASQVPSSRDFGRLRRRSVEGPSLVVKHNSISRITSAQTSLELLAPCTGVIIYNHTLHRVT